MVSSSQPLLAPSWSIISHHFDHSCIVVNGGLGHEKLMMTAMTPQSCTLMTSPGWEPCFELFTAVLWRGGAILWLGDAPWGFGWADDLFSPQESKRIRQLQIWAPVRQLIAEATAGLAMFSISSLWWLHCNPIAGWFPYGYHSTVSRFSSYSYGQSHICMCTRCNY